MSGTVLMGQLTGLFGFFRWLYIGREVREKVALARLLPM